MNTFTILDTPLVVDEMGDALVPDALHGQCRQRVYGNVQTQAWITPELGGVTLAITGDIGGGSDDLEDSVMLTLDDDALTDFIDDLVRLQNRMRALAMPPSSQAEPS
ncbi:hypothetical protein ACFSGX_14065 [Sphingomonas arantia]|uniref:Uncharacterized protein n=1 Tax=Sphingomonas arantia TaxID=1460676 RepID=A0ABW4U1D7_9SPHN